jgi:polysaccharide biosynthesis/export protein
MSYQKVFRFVNANAIPSLASRVRCGSRIVAALALSAALSACSIAPGMRMQNDVRDQVGGTQATTDESAPPIALTEINAGVIAEQQSLGKTEAEANVRDLAAPASAYKVGPADVLQITVWDHPELAQAQGSLPPVAPRPADAPQGFVVDEAGDIQFPFVGRVNVAGLGTAAIQARISKALAHYFEHPQVTVRILSFRAKQVLVDGEVHTPGLLQINDVPMTLSEAIGRAGGFTSSANQGRLTLIRRERIYTLDLPLMLANGQNPSSIVLLRGDVLRVLPRAESSAWVMGEVNRPVAAIPNQNGQLTLADALSQAGSFNLSTSDPRHLYVVRHAQGNSPEVFHLDGRSPVSMVLASKFPLQPDDLVYVDASNLVRANRVLNLLLPAIGAGLTAGLVAK